MLRRFLFPVGGGGALRRFITIRHRILKVIWNDNRPFRGPISLFDFRRPDDAADLRASLSAKMRGVFGCWRTSDDSVIGGYSTSRIEFQEDPLGLADRENEKKNIIAPPFLRWSGNISTRIGQSRSARNVTRSGFAAILSPEYPFGAPLGNKYNALEICCRTDGRTYAVNLHVESYFPEDLYQGFITGGGSEKSEGQQNITERVATSQKTGDEGPQNSIPPVVPLNQGNDNTAAFLASSISSDHNSEQQMAPLDVRSFIKNRQVFLQANDPNNHPYHGHPPFGFQRFILPFKSFILTSRGRMRDIQRDLDGAISIESIGFTLMDGKDGDFVFDLVSLRAVNVLEGEVVDTLEHESITKDDDDQGQGTSQTDGLEENRDVEENDKASESPLGDTRKLTKKSNDEWSVIR